jgi:hypothetical protein
MDFVFYCQHCRQKIIADVSGYGQSILCPNCSANIKIPRPKRLIDKSFPIAKYHPAFSFICKVLIIFDLVFFIGFFFLALSSIMKFNSFLVWCFIEGTLLAIGILLADFSQYFSTGQPITFRNFKNAGLIFAGTWIFFPVFTWLFGFAIHTFVDFFKLTLFHS